MYDELVAWLRSWSELPAHCECYESCDECDKQDICSTFTNERIITKAGEAADAIEELQQIAAHYEETAKDYFKDVCYYLERVPKWIPVTERLPDNSGVYLAAVGKDIRSLKYFCGKWFPYNGNINLTRFVTHWMPLPEPPKEE